MALSLADKLALIYTSAGSQRRVASLAGISHQKVGRILRGEVTPRVLFDPGLINSVNLAFSIHKDITRSQARVDGLPYDSRAPVFIRRMPLKGGAPGDRVAANHTHWISDSLRNAWIASMQQSGKFAAASIGSIVNLVIYNKRAEAAQGGKFRQPEQARHQQTIQNDILSHTTPPAPLFVRPDDNLKITKWIATNKEIRQMIVQGQIYTRLTPLDPRFPTEAVLYDINSKLQEKHAPAVGEPGTMFANTVLLQVDTRKDKNGISKDEAYRVKHPYIKPGKTRRNKKRAKSRKSPR